jgi:O-antigen/teichoic acid export membrane protein
VQPLFAVLSLSFLLTAPGIVQNALLTRELRFRSLELRTIVATAVSCGVGISLAIAGFDAWAIVVQSLVIAAVSTALLWRASSWRPSLTFSVASLRGMTGYAGNVFGTRVLSWAVVNLDNFLIGRFLGPTSLGLYSLAFTLMITPARRIGAPLNRILFPAFSRMDDRRRIARAWLRGVRMLALIVVPATLGLIAVAPDFVPFVFGERWEDAVPVIRILAPVGLIQALMYLNVGVLQAVDRTRTMFRFGLVLSIATVGAFAAGLPWGIEGVAVAYLIVTLILQPFNLRLTSAAVGTTVGDWLRSVRGVVQAGLGMLVVVLVTGELLLESDLAPGVRLAVLIATGAATYAPLVAWRDPDVRLELRELRRLLRSARERPPGSEPPIGTEPPGP